MENEELLAQLIDIQNSLQTELALWNEMQDADWFDATLLKTGLNELNTNINSKKDELVESLNELKLNVDNTFEQNHQQYEAIESEFEELKNVISDFGSDLTEQHVPEFPFSFDSVADTLNETLENISSQVSQLRETLDDDVSARFNIMQTNVKEGAKETTACFNNFLESVNEQLNEAKEEVLAAFEDNKDSMLTAHNMSAENITLAQSELDQRLDDIMNDLKSSVNILSNQFNSMGTELENVQTNLQRVVDTAADCMNLCGSGMNNANRALDTVRSTFEAVG